MPKINETGFVRKENGKTVPLVVIGFATIKDQIYLVCELQGKESDFLPCGLFISQIIVHPDNWTSYKF